MEDKINIEQLIDDYILGRMTSDERHRFEEDLKNDETLLKEYESQSLISRSVSAIHMKHIAAMAEESYQLALADTIDKYIFGDMSNEEKSAFEERMSDNPAVRRRYESQLLISQAVHRNHLRELAEAAETKFQEKKVPFFKRVFGNIDFHFGAKDIVISTPVFRRVAYSFAVAASLAVVAFGGFNFQQHSIAPGIGSDFMASLPQTMVAMGPEDDVAALIDTAQAMMGRKEFAAAEISFNEAICLAQEYISEINAREDRDRYAQKIEVLETYIEDAKWCKAVNYLNDGKARKARKLLKEILSEGGIHSEEAKSALNKMKLFK